MNDSQPITIRPNLESVLVNRFEDWASTFGLSEFETTAASIVEFLKSETPSKHHLLKLDGYDSGSGWDKKFCIGDVPDMSHSIFAAMCVAGYFDHHWFPKWTFTVNMSFIDRCPLASYSARLARDPSSRGYPNKFNNFIEKQ